MSSIRKIQNVNLLWEKRFRGAYAPGQYALSSEATLTLATPRPLEPRAYDLTLHRADGGADVQWGFTVETLLKMEVSDSDDCIGMTADDLYLFHDRSKSRFLADKHVNYIDCALSADGLRLAAIFSDLAGSSFALAYGDITGKLVWLREFDTQVSCVAISRDGSHVLVGDEAGRLTMLDASRRDLWQFEIDSPVRTVACSQNGESIIYGSEGGRTGVIDGDGARRWENQYYGEPVALAISADGSRSAQLTIIPGDASRQATISCFARDGSEDWRHDTERRTTGISLSPEGEFLTVGARDGTISVYSVTYGEGSTAAIAYESALARAQRSWGDGNPGQACAILRTAAQANPSVVALSEDYLAYRTAWFDFEFTAVDNSLKESDPKSAIRILSALLEEDPFSIPAIEKLRSARMSRADQLIELALNLEESGKFDQAEMNLTEAVAVSPIDIPIARTTLAALAARLAEVSDGNAEQMLMDGNKQGAIEALTMAQAKSPDPVRSARILLLHTELEFEKGMAAYNSRSYTEAQFQFKKVLNLNGAHPEAAKYLEYARRFSQESTTDSLQDRFSRLE